MEKFSSALEAFSYWAKKNPNQVFLRQPINRNFIEYTYKDADVEIRKMISGLRNLGIQPGDHIAILSKNCAHWMMADLAIMAAGCISIPIYPTFGAETIFEILEHSYLFKMLDILFSEIEVNVFLHLQYSARLNYFR